MTAPAVAWYGGTNAGIANAVDSAGTWAGATSAFNPDIKIEGSNCRGALIKSTTNRYYYYTGGTLGPYNFASGQANDGDHIFMWIGPMAAVDTLANGGLRLVIVDDQATDAIGEWYVGKPAGVFPYGWSCYVVNPKLAFDNLVAAGTPGWTLSGNPAQLTGIDGFGAGFKTLTSPSGNSPTMFMDAVSVGKGMRLTLGDAGSTEGKFSDFTTFETTNIMGAIRSAGGVLFAKCKLAIGAASGATNTEFIDDGFTVIWEDARVASDFYELLANKGSGTTDITLRNGLLAAASPQTFKLSLNGSTSVTITTLTVDRASVITLDGAVSWDGGIVKNSGAITASGAQFKNVDVSASTVAADAAALIWDINTNPNGYLDGCSFTKGPNAAHAIEFGTNCPASMTLTDVSFSGYNASNGQDDSAIHVKATVGSVTINCEGNPSYKSDGATVTIVSGTKTCSVACTDINGDPVTGVRVFVRAKDGAVYPFEVTVTITNAGTTATVAHTNHGLATGDKVLIDGASLWQNNGVFEITKDNDNQYHYTMPGSPGQNPAGTIKATYVLLADVTGGTGIVTMSRVFSGDFDVIGWARLSSSPGPFYKTAPITGTVLSASGWTGSAVMISDE